MCSRIAFVFAAFVIAGGCLAAAEKYTGPVPPKPDIPYLLHAANLVETEVANAEAGRKSDTFVIEGASSPARTPLAEPIFIIDARNIQPDSFELYRLEVKGGKREVNLNGGRHGSHALHLAVKALGGHLYRVEADEPLEDGEYALSPNGDNHAFCFEIY
jgi:hypothetical protein